MPAGLRSLRRAPDPDAFALDGGAEPASKRGRVAEAVRLVHQVQPDGLADIVGVRATQPVPAADGPDQRGVPLDEGVPGLLVAVSRAHYQVSDRGIITRPVGYGGHDLGPFFPPPIRPHWGGGILQPN